MSADNNTIVVELSKPQAAILNCRAAVILNMAGQGAGKTSVIGYSTGMLIEMFPELAGFLGANTYGQLSASTLKGVFREWKRVFGWTEYHAKSNPGGDFVVDKVPPLHFERFESFKDYHNIISFRSGAIVFLGSLDKYKAHDGKEFAWAHLDETKDTKEEALTEVIFGRLRQMGLWFDKEGNMVGGKYLAEEAERLGLTAWNPCYIHTSPAVAIVQWINEMFQLNPFEEEIRKRVLRKEKDYWSREWAGKAAFIYSTFHNKRFLPPNFIELQLGRMTANKAEKLIYGLPFSKSGSEYYPYFERSKHTGAVKFTPGSNVHQTWDFNVVPYMTLLCAQVLFVIKYRDLVGNKFDDWEEGLTEIQVMKIRFYKEYCLKSPFNSTEAVCDYWKRDHEKEDPDIFFYGDASGKNRIPGLGSLTNFKIIKDALARYVHNSSDRVRVPNVNPLTRRDLMNNILAGKYPEVEVEFDEEMVNTIKDFEQVKLGKDGKIKKRIKDTETGESYESVGHCFVGETLIQTSNGPRRIDEIKPGDMVLTRSGFRPVLKVYDNGIREIETFFIAGKEIKCTPDHKVFTYERGFIPACLLMQSDTFAIFDGKEIIKWQENPPLNQKCKSWTESASGDIRMANEATDFISKDGLKSRLNTKQPFIGIYGKRHSGQSLKDSKFTIKTMIRLIMPLEILNCFRMQIIRAGIKSKARKGLNSLLKFSLKRQFPNLKLGMEAMLVGSGTNNMQQKHLLSIQSKGNAPNVQRNLSKSTLPISVIVPTLARSGMETAGALQRRRVYDIQVQGNHEYFANGVLVHNCSDGVEYLVTEVCRDYLLIH